MGTGIAQVISLSPVRHRDNVLTGEGLLPVLPALRELLPGGGLQRGSVVTSGDWGLLPLALAAEAVSDGAWCAIVGVPAVGVRAAAEAGLRQWRRCWMDSTSCYCARRSSRRLSCGASWRRQLAATEACSWSPGTGRARSPGCW